MIGVQACLNGAREPGAHPRLPLTPADLAADAVAVIAAGANGVHLHPRSADGRQSLAPDDVVAAVAAVRAKIGAVPVGVTTAAWIVQDPAERLAAVAAWAAAGDPVDGMPDFASVNLSEDGAFDLIRVLLDAGVGVEAGVWSVADAQRLVGSGLGGACLRILLEPSDEAEDASTDPAAARAVVGRAGEMLTLLRDDAGIVGPYLLHGSDNNAWAVLRAALDAGLDTRVGLEDTLVGPDGSVTESNAGLVSAAIELVP